MSELRDLYQEVILDHNRQPRNFRELAEPSHEGEGYNPLCGDRVKIYAKIKDDAIEELCFQGSGCAISTASASMLTECLHGKSLAEVRRIVDAFQRMLTDKAEPGDRELLGKLWIFEGVCEYPTRVKCATLVWHTLLAALDGGDTAATTE